MTQRNEAASRNSRTSALDPGMKSVDDAELFSAYCDGDVGAFQELVKRHQAPLYRFCLRSLGNPEAATDATQEVFLRVVKNAPKWERKAKFTTWLYTIARNFCIDETRKGRFRKTESLDEPIHTHGESGASKIDQVSSDLPNAEAALRARRVRSAVNMALESLPAEQREVFCLRQYGGLSFREIAESLDVGENTVKSRMRYALGSIGKTLKDEGVSIDDTS
jgi:RNA polymerase sigma-70 factor, ECF subfamily